MTHAISPVSHALRSNHVFWKYLIAHIPFTSVGSMALELVVVLDDVSTPHILQSVEGRDDGAWPGTAAVAHVRLCMRRVLSRSGLASHPSIRLSDAVTGQIQACNDRTLTLCRTLTECTNNRIIVLRVAIKSVAHISVNAATSKAHFRCGHANLLVLNTERNTMLLIEPAGVAIIPTIDAILLYHTVHHTKRKLFHVFSNLELRGFCPVPDDNLCTIWCAVYGMVCLQNVVTSQATVEDIVNWVSARRNALLRMFLRYAHTVLRDIS